MCRSASAGLLLAAALLSACTPDTGDDTADLSGVSVAELNSFPEKPVGHYGYGSDASAAEVAGWDIDVRPDGLGLPTGSGTAEDGEMLYEEQCAICHGSFGEGVGRYPVLAGGEGTLSEARPEKTVGSFWPYASTLWDYIHRAMPFAEPESLSDDEVYAISAYVLYLNDLLEYDFELSQANLASIEMPNKDGFFIDDRPDVANELCMSNCKDPQSIKITSEPAPAADDTSTAAAVQLASDQISPGRTIYQQACAMCHDSGVGEAPIVGDVDAWSARIAEGREVMIASSLNGKGVMPAKGGHTQLSDEDAILAVDYLLSRAEN